MSVTSQAHRCWYTTDQVNDTVVREYLKEVTSSTSTHRPYFILCGEDASSCNLVDIIPPEHMSTFQNIIADDYADNISTIEIVTNLQQLNTIINQQLSSNRYCSIYIQNLTTLSASSNTEQCLTTIVNQHSDTVHITDLTTINL